MKVIILSAGPDGGEIHRYDGLPPAIGAEIEYMGRVGRLAKGKVSAQKWVITVGAAAGWPGRTECFVTVEWEK